MEYSYEMKVPKDRIAVLIGKKGQTKKQIESATKTKIQLDSKEGDATVIGTDAIGLYTAKEVMRAVSRGFNPDFAMLLLKPDYSFEVFQVGQYAGSSKGTALRLKGRVIGESGKSRKTIEDLTETHISVYGKTIAIIGEIQRVALARRAIESLLKGSPHANVYRWLEQQRKELFRREFEEKKTV